MSVPVESGLFSNWNDIHYNHEQLFASVVHVLIGALNFFLSDSISASNSGLTACP